mmetsp:Transcript_29271/g.83998  ORF Transcript_29271/g.83998 Transcript_29271/m.83998 type:complete len:262 (-) Transcript_29271:304-1089(-)
MGKPQEHVRGRERLLLRVRVRQASRHQVGPRRRVHHCGGLRQLRVLLRPVGYTLWHLCEWRGRPVRCGSPERPGHALAAPRRLGRGGLRRLRPRRRIAPAVEPTGRLARQQRHGLCCGHRFHAVCSHSRARGQRWHDLRGRLQVPPRLALAARQPDRRASRRQLGEEPAPGDTIGHARGSGWGGAHHGSEQVVQGCLHVHCMVQGRDPARGGRGRGASGLRGGARRRAVEGPPYCGHRGRVGLTRWPSRHICMELAQALHR